MDGRGRAASGRAASRSRSAGRETDWTALASLYAQSSCPPPNCKRTKTKRTTTSKQAGQPARTEERRVGKECVSRGTCRRRASHYEKQLTIARVFKACNEVSTTQTG